jgi:Ca-activated chloride channel homolog
LFVALNSALRPNLLRNCRDFGQDNSNYHYRYPEYSALRSFFRLAEQVMLLPFQALPFRFLPLSAIKVILYPVAVGLILITLLLSFPTNIVAQENADQDEIIRVSTELLLFPVRIIDKHGQAVTGLTESDLSLKDDDRITTGLYFSPGTDRVAMVFALDQSGSLREIVSQQREAALALFERFSDRSRIAVLRFSETTSIAAPFGRDLTAAREAFRFAVGTNQHTAIFEAAAKAVNTFEDLPAVRAERRIVILISDGLDNASRIKPTTVIDAAIEKHVSFYVIHLPLFEPRDGHLAVRQASKGFRDLAEKTGGKYFLVRNARSALSPANNDLTPIFQAIEEDLKSQYLLGFYIAESSRDGRKHVFSLGLKPPGIEYSLWRVRYSRTHKFFVNSAPNTKPKS